MDSIDALCARHHAQSNFTEQSIGSSEALPLGFLLLNLFQQDSQWLNYGGELDQRYSHIASGLDSSPKNHSRQKRVNLLRILKTFPWKDLLRVPLQTESGFATVELLSSMVFEPILINFGSFKMVNAMLYLRSSVQRAWHTLSMVQSNRFVIIGGASMMKSSGLLCKAKVAIVKVHFDRTSMSVKLTGVPCIWIQESCYAQCCLCFRLSDFSSDSCCRRPWQVEDSAQLICINAPDTASPTHLRSHHAQRSPVIPPSVFSPPSSPPRPSIPCIAAPVSTPTKCSM
jgi:hypothetical protein